MRILVRVSADFGAPWVFARLSAYFCRTRHTRPARRGLPHSPAAVRAYPADTLVEYWLCWALRGEGLRRADGGTKEVVERLSAGLSGCHLGTRVTALRGGRNGDPWLVKDDKGNTREFDHVILATQAKHAAELLAEYREAEDGAAADARLRRLGEAVGAVRSEAGEMVLCVTSTPANRKRFC